MNTLRLHSSGPEVKALQNLLKEAGFNPGPMDGEFGPGTEQAVKAFQKSEGLLDDGIAGPRTISALTPEQPVESVSILPTVGQWWQSWAGTFHISFRDWQGTHSRNAGSMTLYKWEK